MERMLNELRDEKKELIQKRENLKKDYKAMDDKDPNKAYTLLKIRKIEDDLQSEFFRALEDDSPFDTPSVGKPRPPAKEFEEERKLHLKLQE